jgi:hypothetical protein
MRFRAFPLPREPQDRLDLQSLGTPGSQKPQEPTVFTGGTVPANRRGNHAHEVRRRPRSEAHRGPRPARRRSAGRPRRPAGLRRAPSPSPPAPCCPRPPRRAPSRPASERPPARQRSLTLCCRCQESTPATISPHLTCPTQITRPTQIDGRAPVGRETGDRPRPADPDGYSGDTAGPSRHTRPISGEDLRSRECCGVCSAHNTPRSPKAPR